MVGLTTDNAKGKGAKGKADTKRLPDTASGEFFNILYNVYVSSLSNQIQNCTSRSFDWIVMHRFQPIIHYMYMYVHILEYRMQPSPYQIALSIKF